jgi:hypothetical protein
MTPELPLLRFYSLDFSISSSPSVFVHRAPGPEGLPASWLENATTFLGM